MKLPNVIINVLICVTVSGPITSVYAQSAAPSPAPTFPADSGYYRVDDESDDSELIDGEQGQTPEAQARDTGDATLAGIDAVLNRLITAFGTVDSQGAYRAGSLGKLRLKPSDRLRLIQIANGSLSETDRQRYIYDSRLIELLNQLVTNPEIGGAGFNHIRVADLLRFRHDPRSQETENADNISQHQFGKAADITEINTTRCKIVKRTPFGKKTKKLPPFPVKVAWQGGHGYQSGVPGAPSTLDATVRSSLLGDILATDPQPVYPGLVQGFDELLAVMQRRVIARDLSWESRSLDLLMANDVLATMGYVGLARALSLAPGSLEGQTPDERRRSLAEAALERSLGLLPGSIRGDDWNKSLERLGRYRVALDIDRPPSQLLGPNAGAVIRQSTYYNNTYRNDHDRTEQAYNLPGGTLAGIGQNDSAAFRQIGAQVMAQTLRYSKDEKTALISAAASSTVSQLSLARLGSLSLFPGNPLLILAPGPESSKKDGELAISRQIVTQMPQTLLSSLPNGLAAAITAFLPSVTDTRGLVDTLTRQNVPPAFWRAAGSVSMDQAFDLPAETLAKLIRQTNAPTINQFADRLAQRLLEVYANVQPETFTSGITTSLDAVATDQYFNLTSGTTRRYLSREIAYGEYKQTLGQAFLAGTFTETFNYLYPVPSVGLGAFSLADRFAIVLGDAGNTAVRAGASWVEEDLGMTPGSFVALFSTAQPEIKLMAAGLSVVGGAFFSAFRLNHPARYDGPSLLSTLGQARIETLLGLKPGSFVGNANAVKNLNPDRFPKVFAKPEIVDGMLQLASGATARFLNGGEAESLASDTAKAVLGNVRTDDIAQALGWTLPTDQKIKGNLAKAIESNDTEKISAMVSQIGGYNLDFSLGYVPGVSAQLIGHASIEARNADIAHIGLYLLSEDLMSPAQDDLHDYYDYFLGSSDVNLDNVLRRIGTKLTDPQRRQQTVNRDILDTLDSDLGGTSVNLRARQSDNPTIADIIRQIDNQQSSVNQNAGGDTPLDAIAATNAARGQIPDWKRQTDTIDDPVSRAVVFSILDQLDQSLVKLADYGSNRLTNMPEIALPPQDVFDGYILGDYSLVNSIETAVQMVDRFSVDRSSNTNNPDNVYQLFRILLSGSGSNGDYESALQQEALNRLARILAEQQFIPNETLGNVSDRDVKNILFGQLDRNGRYHQDDSPYDGTTQQTIKSNFLGNQQARDNYFYRTIDETIRKQVSNLPPDFSKRLMTGSVQERSVMLYEFLGTQAFSALDELGAFLPPGVVASLKPAMSDWFANNLDPQLGEALWTNYFRDPQTRQGTSRWAASILSRYMDNPIASSAMEAALGYLFSNNDEANQTGISLIQTDTNARQDLKIEKMAELVGRQLGLPTGQFREYYVKLKNLRQAYADYRAGNISTVQALLLVDQLLLGGAISGFLSSLDGSLGLPSGTMFHVAMFLLTGNPVEVLNIILGFLGGLFKSKLVCPNFKQVAQQNVKALIFAVLRLGEPSARLIPSQIIAYNQSYIDELKDFIAPNYYACLPGSRCGVFARREYVRQVHIGF